MADARRVRSNTGARVFGVAVCLPVLVILPLVVLGLLAGIFARPSGVTVAAGLALGGCTFALIVFVRLLWRWTTRGCRPTDTGLHVRGWRRNWDVPWERVTEVRDTPLRNYGRNGMDFAHTDVCFVDGVGRDHAVTVSARWHSSGDDAAAIVSWSPPGHRLRRADGVEQAEPHQ